MALGVAGGLVYALVRNGVLAVVGQPGGALGEFLDGAFGCR
ncbi:hypothetical protein [Streptomyces sp. NPDC006463]